MKKQLINFGPILLIGGGLLVLSLAVFPIIQYEISAYFNFHKTELISPVAADEFLPTNPRSVITGTSSSELNRASDWFVGTPDLPVIDSKVKYYNLTVPRLKIEDAVVEIGGEDLDKNLVQYKGTALPGTKGNSVVFGHSALPQFFKPTDYLSIFAKLPTLQLNDELIVNYDGITYHYRVEEMFEVHPTDIEVLAQRYDDSYLTLVTCVPPGTTLRRLIVRARLIPTS